MNSFTACGITAGYGNKTVISDICFQAKPGSILGIAGPNGSGKSTLIRSVCNLLPHQGTCGFQEPFEQMSEKQLARLCSYLPQKSGLMLDLSVLDIVLMAYNPVLGVFSSPTGEMVQNALKAIAEAGLKGKEHAGFLQLSGGERQLCLLARALVLKTPLLVLDEPENSLDPFFRIRIMNTLRKRVNEEKTAALISLHDMNLALNFCDKILLIKDGSIHSVLDPLHDTESEMETKLVALFGRVCVKQIRVSSGEKQFVMLTAMHPGDNLS